MSIPAVAHHTEAIERLIERTCTSAVHLLQRIEGDPKVPIRDHLTAVRVSTQAIEAMTPRTTITQFEGSKGGVGFDHREHPRRHSQDESA